MGPTASIQNQLAPITRPIISHAPPTTDVLHGIGLATVNTVFWVSMASIVHVLFSIIRVGIPLYHLDSTEDNFTQRYDNLTSRGMFALWQGFISAVITLGSLWLEERLENGNQTNSTQEIVSNYLNALSARWKINHEEVAVFRDYLADKMWGTRAAKVNPAVFAEAQLTLLEQMDNDTELRKACLSLAVAGSSDCHDNAYAMFLKMLEKAQEIAMHKPHVPVNELINYGLALENKALLDALVDQTPTIKNAINAAEGTEALLALQLLCHKKNIILPIPVTAMNYEKLGFLQFSESWFNTAIGNKNRVSALIDEAIPQRAQPSA